MLDYSKILLANSNLVKAVVDFFTSQATNPALFEEIKKSAIATSKQMKKRNAEIFLKLGYFSAFDFAMYASDNKEKFGLKGGIQVRIVEMVLSILKSKLIVTQIENMLTTGNDIRYQVNKNYAILLDVQGLTYNLMFGFQYIISNYENSVIKIENIDKNKDHAIGTGFVIFEENRSLVVTNKHVLKDAIKLKLYNKADEIIEYDTPYTDDERDLAFIPLKEQLSIPHFQFALNLELLSEIITIGYPSIPMTKLAYQICHKGEINSSIEDYYGNKLFLISAKTSSGNSGSPVINNTGAVVGIITEELFEKKLFQEKGKLPYYAAIPSSEIIDSLNEYKKDYD